MRLPLHILGASSEQTESPCRFDTPEMTFLLALMPGKAPPEMEMILQSIADFTGLELGVRTAASEDTGAHWACMLEIEGLPHPVVLWCDDSDDVGTVAEDITGVQCPWMIGIESRLSTSDPLTSYINLVRILIGGLPDFPVIHDACSGHWLEYDRLELDFMHDVFEPPEDVLWRIEVHSDEAETSDSFDVLTRGLARCGRAELELLNVPETLRSTAIEFISDLASLSLEVPFPGPDGSLEIGPDLQVVFQLHDRESEPANESTILHATVRDAGTDTNEDYPEHVLKSISTGNVALYRTERRTQQSTLRSQATWRAFLDACLMCLEHDTSPADCFVQVPFEQAQSEDERREHLWLQVVKVDNDSAEARLVHPPRIVQGLEIGWTTTVTAEEISSWLIQTPDSVILPDDPGALQELLASDGES